MKYILNLLNTMDVAEEITFTQVTKNSMILLVEAQGQLAVVNVKETYLDAFDSPYYTFESTVDLPVIDKLKALANAHIEDIAHIPGVMTEVNQLSAI